MSDEEKFKEEFMKILNQIKDQTKPKPQNTESSEKHEHEPPKKAESAIEHIDTCPTCRTQFKEKLRSEVLKDVVDKVKGDYNCIGCGLKVERETETCPLCGKRPF